MTKLEGKLQHSMDKAAYRAKLKQKKEEKALILVSGILIGAYIILILACYLLWG